MQKMKLPQNTALKSLILACATAASLSAHAGGPLDGVYSCAVSIPGIGVSTIYQTINTNAQGQTVTAPANVTAGTAVVGYGLGLVTGYTLTGTTDKGQSFVFSLNPVTLTATGIFNLVGANGLLPTTYNCTKIW